MAFAVRVSETGMAITPCVGFRFPSLRAKAGTSCSVLRLKVRRKPRPVKHRPAVISLRNGEKNDRLSCL
ncbi:hypothetical protein FKM82_029987 [Ascaphus truei]